MGESVEGKEREDGTKIDEKMETGRTSSFRDVAPTPRKSTWPYIDLETIGEGELGSLSRDQTRRKMGRFRKLTSQQPSSRWEDVPSR